MLLKCSNGIGLKTFSMSDISFKISMALGLGNISSFVISVGVLSNNMGSLLEMNTIRHGPSGQLENSVQYFVSKHVFLYIHKYVRLYIKTLGTVGLQRQLVQAGSDVRLGKPVVS